MAELVRDTSRRGWRFWVFIGFMLVLMTVFIGLGVWQLERLGEKERLIAEVSARLGGTPFKLPPVAEWSSFDSEGVDFRPYTVTGTWAPQGTVLVFTSLDTPRGRYSGPGDWVMTPLELEGGGTLFVNRGFVPQAGSAAFAAGGPTEPGTVTLTGIARAPEAIGAFTPGPDARNRVEWVRDPTRLAAMAGPEFAPVVPITLDLPAEASGALPQGGETVVEFPNNHLGYAFTWFGFAVLIPPLLFLWIRRQRRERP